MISKVTESNKALFEARIAQINKALEAKHSDTRITSFESYFGNIREIQQLQTSFVGSASGDSSQGTPGKFLLMPLDEPLFEIDANKRTITIPANFSKNGVGVRGDHMAETLYFKIDRYFDHQDLFNVDEIIINWQFRGANESRNKELETHTSLAFAPDDEYIPGCVVFGWVIDNEMTPSKGTLSFSVSFLKKENNRYQYALNTTIATVNVNDSLYLEDPSILSSMKRPVFERLVDSRYTEDSAIPVGEPVWRTGEQDEDENGNTVLRGLPAIANFELKDDGSEADTLLLQAIGNVPKSESVNMKYDWTGSSFATGQPIEGRSRDSISVESDWVLTADTAPQAGVTYYVLPDDGEPITLSDTSDPSLEDAFAEDSEYEVYELGSSFEVEEGGSYMVTMQAVRTTALSDGSEVKSQSGAVESIVCVVPNAAVPSVELSATAINPTSIEGVTIEDEEEAAKHVFVGDGSPNVKAKVTIDTSKMDIDKGIIEGSSLGAVAFKLAGEGVAAPVESEFASMTFQHCVEGQEFSVESSSAAGEGDYCVYAVNRRNHTYGISDASNKINVSKIAPALSNISVFARDVDPNGYDFALISNNNYPADAIKTPVTVELNPNHLFRDFQVVVGDDLSSIGSEGDRVSMTARILELDQNKTTEDELVFLDSSAPSYNDVPPDVYEMTLGEGASAEPNIFYCRLEEAGWFVVEVTTHYHGIARKTYTKPFKVNSTF